jgi:hypothetical protein
VMMKRGLRTAMVSLEETNRLFHADYNWRIGESRERQKTNVFQVAPARPERRNQFLPAVELINWRICVACSVILRNDSNCELAMSTHPDRISGALTRNASKSP